MSIYPILAYIRGLSKKYPTIIFPMQSSDAKAAPFCMVEEGTLVHIKSFKKHFKLTTRSKYKSKNVKGYLP